METINIITGAEMLNIIENMKNEKKQGLFLEPSGSTWTACDNSDGYAWTEDFTEYRVAVAWLLGYIEV